MIDRMEYISREDFCEDSCGIENRKGYKTCKNCGMLNVPSADVQPVKRGRWDYRGSGSPEFTFRCSCCENISPAEYSYCPNCGARMEGFYND